MKKAFYAEIYFLLFALTLVLLAGSFLPGTALAQTETPTPTPDTVDEVEIDGQYFRIERSISYGEIAVTIVGLALFCVACIYVPFKIITHFLR